jgi:hypothetical protein
MGFREFAIVDRVTASDVVAAYGNRVVMLTPHCLPNGVVTIEGVSGLSVGELAVAVPAEAGGSGGFAEGTTVGNITGCGGLLAQEPHPDQDSYLLAPSRVALIDGSPTVEFQGPLTWPAVGSSGGLADGTGVDLSQRVKTPACVLPG